MTTPLRSLLSRARTRIPVSLSITALVTALAVLPIRDVTAGQTASSSDEIKIWKKDTVVLDSVDGSGYEVWGLTGSLAGARNSKDGLQMLELTMDGSSVYIRARDAKRTSFECKTGQTLALAGLQPNDYLEITSNDYSGGPGSGSPGQCYVKVTRSSTRL